MFITTFRVVRSIIPRLFGALSIFLAFCFSAMADEVVLKDGSRLVGEIKQMMGDMFVIDTAFASGLEIKPSMVAGISTTGKVTVELKSGDRLKHRAAPCERSRR